MKNKNSLFTLVLNYLLILILLFVSFVQNIKSVSASSDSWVVTGSLNTYRGAHTITVLSNGRVLVAGGSESTTVEIYNPNTGLWTETDSMTEARSEHASILLSDGTLLVAGGHVGSTNKSSAEIYDPDIGLWSDTGSMNDARYSFSMSLLPNGQVLVAGGVGEGGVFLDSAELYDPMTGVWSYTGSLNVARSTVTSLLLANGKVLLGGGQNSSFITSAELYDPHTGLWTYTGSMNTYHHYHPFIQLNNDKVLIAGSPSSSASELYDPDLGTWSYTGSMNVVRRGAAIAMLPDGKVLAAGGSIYGGPSTTTSAEVYDPVLETWSPIVSMNAAFPGKAVLLQNGKVLVAGGTNAEIYDNGQPSVTIEQASGQIDPTNEIPVEFTVTFSEEVFGFEDSDIDFSGSTAPGALTASISGTGPIYSVLVSGMTGSGLVVASIPAGVAQDSFGKDNLVSISTDNTITYNYPYTIGEWTLKRSMNSARSNHTITLLNDDTVLVVGGDFNNDSLSSSEIYNPVTNIWSATESMHIERFYHTATLLFNGKVLVAGGQSDSGTVSSAELYDPDMGTWEFTGSMNSPRKYFTSTLLPDGSVLVVGGSSDISWRGATLNSAEIYDPVLGTWSYTGSMACARADHTATLLPNGKVLVVGGIKDNQTPGYDYYDISLKSAELYDPTTGVWESTVDMNNERVGHTATLLYNGKVIVAGGLEVLSYKQGSARTYSYTTTNSVELYDPSTDSWECIDPMNDKRKDHTATLLPDGKVLIAGGDDYYDVSSSGFHETISNTSELFDPILNTWSFTGSLNVARTFHRTVLLPREMVLTTGGSYYTGSWHSIDSAEIYKSNPILYYLPLIVGYVEEP